MAWFYLVVAGVLEVIWAVLMKQSALPGKAWYAGPMVAGMIASFVFLWLAMKSLPVGTAYAVWTGIGAVGVAAVGIFLFEEPRGALRLMSFVLIILGIVGLKATSQ